MDNNTEYSPKEYFTNVKSNINTITHKDLQDTFDCCLAILENYKKAGQISAMKKLMFQLDCIEKEEKLIDLGINTFIYKEDVKNFIDVVSKNVVKIIELKNYERTIPNEIVDKVVQTRDIFNEFYVIFTDYTGKTEREVTKTKREKDPILVGTFQDTKNKVMLNKMYFIGDWVDDYCDLTLSKMVELTKSYNGKNIANNISTEQHIKELKDYISMYDVNATQPNTTFTHIPVKDTNKLTNFIQRIKKRVKHR